ncbi:MAG: hypothetical protein R3F49_03110 [Planctomycetota bacterium]
MSDASPTDAALARALLAPAELELGADGRARSRRFGDMYQPDADGAQARAVFLAGNGLPQRFAARAEPFTVLELGFGTGLNFIETWRAWRGSGAPCALRYIGVDGFPLTRDEARQVALARAALGAAGRERGARRGVWRAAGARRRRDGAHGGMA